MQVSNNEKSITAYFSTTGEVLSAGDQLHSLLQVNVPKSIVIEQVPPGSSNYTPPTPMEGDYKMTVAIPKSQSDRAKEIIRSQGGVIQ